MNPPRFFPLVPGARLPGDWFDAPIPRNIHVGANCVIDSAFGFKQYFSTLDVGLRVGDDVTFWRTSLAAEEGGLIEVGSGSYIANASIVCTRRVTIGQRVLIAGGVTIADSDFHPIGPAERLADTIALSPAGDRSHRPAVTAAPVAIGDDVWIGWNAAVLKGVSIGAGAIVCPGAVVLRDVAPGAMVRGNPARLVDAVAEP